MPLRDIAPFLDWIVRDSPTAAHRSTVADWVANLDENPWQRPSLPIYELSDPPFYEVRSAVVPRSGNTQVIYVLWYASGAVDLLWVG